VTPGSQYLLYYWHFTAWSRALTKDHPDRSDPDSVRGNRFTTVPKDATQNRGIAVEPSINGFYQLAVGQLLRRRLSKYGINLEEGQTIHRRVACEASIYNHFSTIDLSSASDTVSKNLVKLLLPGDWYQLLDSLRSPVTQIGDKTVYLNKFSSMGNGFTFELETLIFLVLSIVTYEFQGKHLTAGSDVFVYGDDIIVPREGVECLISLLRFSGLTVNRKKTFITGSFKESCGGDFFSGVNVRPHYLKEYPNDPQTWISLANGIRRMVVNHNHSGGRVRMPQRAWFRALDHLPTNIRRLRGPDALGDLVIHDCEERWSYRWRHSIRFIRVWRPVTRGIPLSKWSPLVQLASALYGVPSTGPILRGSVKGYKVGLVPYS
jgi:hypothetical protein